MNDKYIYLLDERLSRREKLAPYLKDLPLIRCFDVPNFFSTENIEKELEKSVIICLHDSFFNGMPFKSDNLKKRIQTYSEVNRKPLVIFGGGIFGIRYISEKYWLIPVTRLYENLPVFYESSFLKGNIDISFLAFGENIRYEQILSIRARLTYQIHHLKKEDKVNFSYQEEEDLKRFSELVNDNTILDIINHKEDLKQFKFIEWLNTITKKFLYEK